MRQATVTIVNRLGLHARPAAELVKVSSRFRSRITLSMDDVEVDGKSIMGVMMLAAPRGSVLMVRAVGEDAEAAVTALVDLVNRGFGESLE
jgi:phosphocarrier protein HPr